MLTFLLQIWNEVLFLSLPFRWKNWRFDTNAWLPNELKSRGVSLCKTNFIDRKWKKCYRSNHPDVFCKIGVLRIFAKFTGKHLCQSLCFNKVAGLRPALLLKKRIWHRPFPVNFVKFLETPFLNRTPPVAASGTRNVTVWFSCNL